MSTLAQKTYMAKQEDVKRDCYVIDAKDKILGRVAAKVAAILRGKHKVIYTPHVDTGDMVVIINAEKIRVTGRKLTDKVYYRYSGYPSGQKAVRLEEMLAKKPTQVLRSAINRMIPEGRLGDSIRKRIKIYAGEIHPHQAQKPVVLQVG